MRIERWPGKGAVGAVVLAAAMGVACGDGPAVARIESPEGELRLEVVVERAVTAEERQTGLRERNQLSPDEGLLLVFPVTGEVCVVNDGVAFPIDAAFVGPDGVVIAVERAIPAGDPSARCHPGTREVLEVAAGVAERVAVDDRLTVH